MNKNMGCTRADITNMNFGRLTAVCYVGDRQYKCGKKLSMWMCKCECGKETIVSLSALRTGNTKSCGCLNKEWKKTFTESHVTHGDADSRLYHIWEQMRRRCHKKYDRSYKFYGGKGVSVCEEWRNNYGAFREWAINNGYDPSAKRGKCTIDRINPYEDYKPDNCRWISMQEQYKNLRRHWKDGEHHDALEAVE